MKKELNDSLEKFKSLFPVKEIATTCKGYLKLRINGVDDVKNYQLVFQALQDIKKPRLELEKERKKEKAAALEYGNAVDRAAKELSELMLITDAENHLKSERRRIDDIRDTIKAKKALENEIVRVWDEAHTANIQYDEQKAETARLEAQRIEQEKIAAKLAKRQAEIARKERENRIRQEERERMAAEKQAAIDKAEREKQETEKARAKAETERIAKEKAEKQARIDAEKEKKRIAKSAPDKIKLRVYLLSLVNVPLPTLRDKKLIALTLGFHDSLKANCQKLLDNFK